MDDSTDNPTAEPTTPACPVPPPGTAWETELPRRFVWLKRIAVGAGVVLVLLVGLRLWWGYAAKHALDRKIAELRAAGYGVYPEDMPKDDKLRSEEAAELWDQAAWAAAQVFDPNGLGPGDLLADRNLITLRRDDVDALIAGYTPAFDLLRKAREMPPGEWNIPWGISAVLPAGLAGYRALAKAICDVAVYDAFTGDFARGVAHLRDALAIGCALRHQRGFLINMLVSIAVDSLAAGRVEQILMHAASIPNAGAERPAAIRTEAAILIDVLIDETEMASSWIAAWHRERHVVVDELQQLLDAKALPQTLIRFPRPMPRPRDHALAALLSPAWRVDAIGALEECVAMERASLASTYSAGNEQSQWVYAYPRTTLPAAVRFWHGDLLDRVVLLKFRATAQRRLAATALAIYLYKLDTGERPATLTELVPTYLPTLPTDPFSPDGATFRYRPHGERGLIYSLGPNGVDDGGVNSEEPDGGDLLFHLDPPPPGDDDAADR